MLQCYAVCMRSHHPLRALVSCLLQAIYSKLRGWGGSLYLEMGHETLICLTASCMAASS